MAAPKASTDSKVSVPTAMLADGWPPMPPERPWRTVMPLRASPHFSDTIGMCLLT
jgi:hypothetical protein